MGENSERQYVIDDYNREAIAIEVVQSMPSLRVTELLERIIQEQGKPKNHLDWQWPDFIRKEFNTWCEGNNIEIRYTQPGRRMQNGYIEGFSRSFRESILDAYLFEDIMRYKYWQKNGCRIIVVRDHMKP